MSFEKAGDQHVVRLTTTQTERAKALADAAGFRLATWLKSLVLAEIARAERANLAPKDWPNQGR